MTLPAALQPLAGYRQFILWRLVSETDAKTGIVKQIKKPVSPLLGYTHDPHDRAHWVDYETAAKLVDPLGCNGVAFVFADTDPFFFIDIDKCRVGDDWSPLAKYLCGLFSGAAVEVSQSGNGLHLFGTGTAPEHACKNSALGIEFYTSGRFVALTGNLASGNATTDHTAALATLVAQYFPFDAGSAVEAGEEAWSDVADPEWNGPADDDELLRMMFNQRVSVGQAVDGKATPRDLFNANAEVLTATYPPASSTSYWPWDGNVADMALAQSLAFWTGRNTARIKRLMYKSKLVRDKWDKHKHYLWDTVSKACARTKNVYQSRKTDAPTLPPQSSEIARAEGMQFMTTTQQPEHFTGCVYVRDIHRAFVPDGALLKPEQFRVQFGGYLFSMDPSNDKVTRNAWEVFTESQAIRFPKAEAPTFRPELPPGTIIEEEGRKLINTYVPVETRRVKGDATPFLTHTRKLLPDERDHSILIAYLAALVQYPGVKFQWCPVLQGAEGNGKTVIVRAITHSVGHRYSHLPNAQALGESGSTFNAWIDRKLFIGIEEINTHDRADILEALKPLITNDRIEIQYKTVDQITGDNRANFVMCCNPKEAIAVGVDKRRYCIFYTAQQSYADIVRDGMGGDYFSQFYAWLKQDGYAIVNDYLRSYAIPDELNPATKLTRAPETSSTAEMLTLSHTSVEQEILEAIGEGRVGFANGWISSLRLDQLLKDTGNAKKVPPANRRKLLRGLGYDWHPALFEGRVNNKIPLEGDGKPRLFIRTGHIASALTECASVVSAYLQAQGVIGAVGTLPAGARASL